MPTNKTFRVMLCLCLLGVLLPASAQAQTAQARVYVNDLKKSEPVTGPAGMPGLSLDLAFNLLDDEGQVMTNAQVETATIGLEDGAQYPAIVQKAETPWSIVVLVDASKTMASANASAAFKTARYALADAIQQVPRGSNLAVLKFDSRPTTVLGFTRATDQVQAAIRKNIQANASGTSCLNDGARESVSMLREATGQRALLILTASADNCGQSLSADVIQTARENHIQIYAVGLKGYTITEDELQSLTGGTGGLANMREQDEVIFAFENIMNALNLRWQAVATVYPTAGEHTAQLGVVLKDSTILLSDPVSFQSAQHYVRPPEIALTGSVLSIARGVRFSLDYVSPELIDQLNVSIVSVKTGRAVNEQSLTEITETYEVAAENLVAGEEYTLVIVAVDSTANRLAQTTADFTYEPPQANLTITQVDPPTAGDPAFVIQVQSGNLDGVVKYKVWLMAEGSEQPVTGSVKTVPAGDPIRIPADELESGEYTVAVQALDGSNTALAQALSAPIAYQRPSGLEVALNWIRSSPLALVAITLIGGVAFFGLVIVALLVARLVMPKAAASKQVELALPEVKRRPPPVSLEPAPARPEPEPRASMPQRPRPVDQARPPLAPDQPALPKALLTGHSPAELRLSARIAKSPFTIGRRESNDLVIQVDNKTGVSGRHATVTFSNGRFYIVDDKSSYGVLLNEVKIQPGTPTPLESGVIISLGPKVKIQFHLGDRPA